MSREDGRSGACEAEAAEGTPARTLPTRGSNTETAKAVTGPPAVGSIRMLYGNAVPVLVSTSSFHPHLLCPEMRLLPPRARWNLVTRFEQ